MFLNRVLFCVLVICATSLVGTPSFAEQDCVICDCLEDSGNLIFKDETSPVDPEKLLVESPSCMVTRLNAETQKNSPFVWLANAVRKRMADGGEHSRLACYQQWNVMIETMRNDSSNACLVPDAGEMDKFASELTERCNDDQLLTTQIFPNPSLYATPEAETCSDWPQPLVSQLLVLGRTDNVHFLEANGFPDNWESLIRKAPALDRNLWLLVQHADNSPAFQKRALEVYSGLLRENLGNLGVWAQLSDRVSINQKGWQIYGTHWKCVDGEAIPSVDITDSEHVDAVRAEVGLPPLAEFLSDVSTQQCTPQE